MSVRKIKIKSYEKGLHFRDDEFTGVLDAGKHWMLNPFRKDVVRVESMRDPWIHSDKLDLIYKTGELDDDAIILDVQDYQRALVWIDGRFDSVLAGGLYGLWTTHRDIQVEIVDAREVRFNHPDMNVIYKSAGASELLEEVTVEEDHVGVLFQNSRYVDVLDAGRYVFWKGVELVKVFQVNISEMVMDISGQEIMTADKVTLRMNAIVAYVVKDAKKAVSATADFKQALYRETQLALRGLVGVRELEDLLTDKDVLADELKGKLVERANSFGLEVASLGIRDVILPGDMKELLNKVTEAKKAAEANLVSRREETAAMRSQANTAKLLESNPVLMRLRELEVLEKISTNSKLNVILGEKGLADKVVNLL